MFDGKCFCLKGFDRKKKEKLGGLIKENGGCVSYFVSRQVTHLVVPSTGAPLSSSVKRYNISVVTEAFVIHSVSAGALVSDEFYRPIETLKGETSTIFGSSTGRNIRVFISSTFKDMRKERTILRKRIIHKLNQYCHERLLSFSFVDFSWGISDQMTQDGEVILRCLQEVNRCLPYFVTFLGERYGWHHPEYKIDDLLQRNQLHASQEFPWIDEYKDRSITELEIRAALRAENNAFVYLRSSSYDKRRNLGGAESPYATFRLAQLKQEIYEKVPKEQIREYQRTKEIYSMVEKDLKHLIELHFPLSSLPNPFHYEKVMNERYASQCAMPFVDINYQMDSLRSYTSGYYHTPCLLYGPSGSGKTCFLSAYYQSLLHEKSDFADSLVLCHYVRQSSKSSHYWILSRVIHEQSEYCSNSLRVNGKENLSQEFLLENFLPALEKISANGKCVLFIDEIDLVDNIDQARRLEWIPNSLPHGVKLIVTSSSPQIYKIAEQRSWEIVQVPSIENEEYDKKRVVESHLKVHNKALPSHLVDKLVESEQTGHLRFLANVISELLYTGTHDDLEDLLQSYLQAEDTIDLFDMILKRLEENGNSSKFPRAVQDITAALISSRSGLTETEILQVTKIKRSSFIRIFGSLQFLLGKRDEIFVVNCTEAIQAIIRRNEILSNDWEVSICERMADYFLSVPDWPTRKLHELPWLLKKTKSRKQLRQILLEPDVLFYHMEDEVLKYDLIDYWKTAMNSNDLSVSVKLFWDYGEASRMYLNAKYNYWAGKFFYEIARYANAISFYDMAMKFERSDEITLCEHNFFLSNVADAKANSEKLLGEYRDAYKSSMKAIELLDSGFESIESPSKEETYKYRTEQIPLLTNLTSIYEKLNKLKKAEAAAMKALSIAEETVSATDLLLARAKNSLGIVLKKQKRFYEALPYYQDALRIRKQVLGSFHVLTAQSLNNLGNLSKRLDRMDAAENYYMESCRVYRHIFGDIHAEVAQSKFNMALLYSETFRVPQALEIFQESHGIFQQHPKLMKVIQVAILWKGNALVYRLR